jgi:hypothetical protein
MALPAVWPSVTCHGVGTLIAIISQLNTLPACAPVNASMAASRLAMHNSGSGWLAMPFLCDSFIHYSTPVLSRRTTRAAKRSVQFTRFVRRIKQVLDYSRMRSM